MPGHEHEVGNATPESLSQEAPARQPSDTGLLSLQRTAGNGAVTRGLAAGALPIQRVPTRAEIDQSYQAAVQASQWERAAIVLNGFNDPDIARRVALLSDADKAAMLAAAPAWVVRVRIALIGTPAPGARMIPWDRTPKSAPGERIIFNNDFTHATPGLFQLVYTGTGGTFDAAGGSATKTIPGLSSGNVDFHIDAAWTGSTAVNVRLEVQLTDGTVARTETWTFSKKGTTPTTMTQTEPDTERPLGSVYTYQLGPNINGPGRPDYQHQTILERFEARTCNITLAELKPAYATANGLTDAATITAHFFGTSSNNGTFTVDAHDRVYDAHRGGMPDKSVFEAALTTMKEITVDLPQIYEVEPGVPLARYTIRRICKMDGTKMLRKFRTGP